MNRYTKEHNKLKEELIVLENEYDEVKVSYDNEYNLYNAYCDSIKDMKYQLISLNKKYSKRWNLFYRGLSFSVFFTSSIILTLLNINLLPSIILSLVSTGIVLGGSIIFSDMIKKLPMFSTLINKINELSSEKQKIFNKNEETKKIVSTLCKELDDIRMNISSKKEQIANFENALYSDEKTEIHTDEVSDKSSEVQSPLIRKRSLL